MENETRFSYDDYSDSLIISSKADNEKVKKNFMFDNFVISLTRSGKIVGLEIRDISLFLKEIGFNPSILENLGRIELNVIPKKDTIFIGFRVYNLENHLVQQIPISHVPVCCLN